MAQKSEPKPQPAHSVLILRNTFAGSVAGVASLLVCHPLDVIRTRLQTTNQFRGAFDVVKQTIVKEGPRAMYKGMLAPLAAQAVYKAVLFASYTQAQDIVRKTTGNQDKLSLPELYFCGAIAGATNSFVVAPVELARNRLIAQYQRVGSKNPTVSAATAAVSGSEHYTGPLDVVRKVLKAEGITGLWRGLSSTLARDIPGVGAWYCAYEVARRMMVPVGKPPGDYPFRLMACGACGGIGFWLVGLPFDTVKSIVQTDLQNKYRGFFDCARQVIKSEGIGRLYRGLGVAISRGIPGSAVVFSTQNLVMKWIS